MNLAPIILFVYNRPEHTRKTLEALSLNELAALSTLYIYSDGAKEHCSIDQLKLIQQTRNVIKENKWCGEVNIIESAINKGLANSVIEGVTEILQKNDSVIVLEDDIITENGFLKFMNQSLELYKDQERVFGISGYKFDTVKPINQSTYFLPVMSSWGYATWSNKWLKIDFNATRLNQQVFDRNLKEQMKFGSLDFYKMLQLQISGRLDSWAVRFYTSMLLQNGLFLYPKRSLLRNIGFDGSGVHCQTKERVVQHIATSIIPKKIAVKVDSKIYNKFQTHHVDKRITVKNLKKKLKRAIAPELLLYYRRKKNHNKSDQFDKLRKTPRFVQTTFNLDAKKIIVPDAASFNFMYEEIFVQEIYKFTTQSNMPYIIDGGANIGLATLYFKKLFPNSEIIAFEPDTQIFKTLEKNIKSFGLKNITLMKYGLWNKNETLNFYTEGADGGTIDQERKNSGKFESIEVQSLLPYLNKTVDFLKLDIEGAESVVIKDIESHLYNVNRIFVEYHSFVRQTQNLGEIISILENSGFRLHINAPGLSSKQPFQNLKVYNNMDMQLNIYGIREKLNK